MSGRAVLAAVRDSDAIEADAEELRRRLLSLILGYPLQVVLCCLGAQTEALLCALPMGEREWATLKFVRRLSEGVLAHGDDDGEA